MIKKVNSRVRTRYGARQRAGITFSEPSMTKQNHKAECDINNIMRRFTKTGVIDHVTRYEPRYGDVPSQDYHSALITVSSAQELFEELPAVMRKHFDNDPGLFLEYVQDPSNPALPDLYASMQNPPPVQTNEPDSPKGENAPASTAQEGA